MANAYTLTSDLLVPAVWAEVIQAEFTGKLIMRTFANVDTSLVGVPGDTINFPEFTLLQKDGSDAEAEELTENVAQETAKLQQVSTSATVKEVGQGFSVTDQSSLYAIGNALAEGRRQLPILLSRKVDLDLGVDLLSPNDSAGVAPGGGGFDQDTAPLQVGDGLSAFDVDAVSEAVSTFGDEATPEEMQALLVTSDLAHKLRISQVLKDSTAAAGSPVILNGQVGTIYGVPVIQSNRGMTEGQAALVGPANPLDLIMKAMPEVELEREAAFRRTNVYTRVHYGTRRRVPQGVVLINYDPAA